MLYNQCITHSKLSTICIANYNATCWASWSRRLTIISSIAALATMYEKVTSTTDFLWFLRIQIKWARSLSCLMHHIFAESQFINRCRQRANVLNTLHIRIEISFFLSRISISLDSKFSLSSDKFTSFLIVCIGHRLSIWECSTAIEAAIWPFNYLLKRCLFL